MSFAERLKSLIGEESVSGFARRVDISEALIRKYLKGSEPSLAKANQIAMKANCSLEWLATGCGYLYRQAEVVDKIALYAAFSHLYGREPSETEAEKIKKNGDRLSVFTHPQESRWLSRYSGHGNVSATGQTGRTRVSPRSHTKHYH